MDNNSLEIKKLKYWADGEYKNIIIRNRLRKGFKANQGIDFNTLATFPNGLNSFYIPTKDYFVKLIDLINNINKGFWERGSKRQIHINTFPSGRQGSGMLSWEMFSTPCKLCNSITYITPTIKKGGSLEDKNLDGYFYKQLSVLMELKTLIPFIIEDDNLREREELEGHFRSFSCPHTKPKYYAENGKYVGSGEDVYGWVDGKKIKPKDIPNYEKRMRAKWEAKEKLLKAERKKAQVKARAERRITNG